MPAKTAAGAGPGAGDHSQPAGGLSPLRPSPAPDSLTPSPRVPDSRLTWVQEQDVDQSLPFEARLKVTLEPGSLVVDPSVVHYLVD